MKVILHEGWSYPPFYECKKFTAINFYYEGILRGISLFLLLILHDEKLNNVSIDEEHCSTVKGGLNCIHNYCTWLGPNTGFKPCAVANSKERKYESS